MDADDLDWEYVTRQEVGPLLTQCFRCTQHPELWRIERRHPAYATTNTFIVENGISRNARSRNTGEGFEFPGGVEFAMLDDAMASVAAVNA